MYPLFVRLGLSVKQRVPKVDGNLQFVLSTFRPCLSGIIATLVQQVPCGGNQKREAANKLDHGNA